MDSLILLFICLLIGIGLQHVKAFPTNASDVLNAFVIYISLPALALLYIPKIVLESNVLFPILSAWIVLIFSFIVILAFARIFNWDKATIGCLLLTAGFGNTSFVGFPVIEALYGEDGLKMAFLVDQPGSFVAISTVGILIASVFSNENLKKRAIIRKIILFPRFISFLVAIGMNISGIEATGTARYLFERLGATLAPVALISVGMQLKLKYSQTLLIPLLCGLSFKLFIAPTVILLIYVFVFGGEGLAVKVSILESAMAPMITGSIVAIMFGLNARLASLMVGFGVPISFVTLFFWYFIIEYFLNL